MLEKNYNELKWVLSSEDMKRCVWWEECRVVSTFLYLFIYLFYIEAYLESRRARAPRGDGGVAERPHVWLICKISRRRKKKTV